MISRITAFIIAALALSAPSSAMGATSTRFQAARPSLVVLEGSSNLADWRCSSRVLEAVVEVGAPIEQINRVIDRIEDGNVGVWLDNPAEARFPQPSFHLRIPVSSLRCGNRMMERDLNEALKVSHHPAIEFRFTELRGGIRHDIDAGHYGATISGELYVAGVKRRVDLPVIAHRLSLDRFRVRAELPIRMTDFGITPPTVLFGMIKARDPLRVRFDLVLEVVSAEAAGFGVLAGH